MVAPNAVLILSALPMMVTVYAVVLSQVLTALYAPLVKQ
jgi:hypothetical protein